MNYWIISDTHFGHEKLQMAKEWPKNSEDIIFDRLKKCVKEDDVIIHLGDFAWSDLDKWLNKWHDTFYKRCASTILVKGNHDCKSHARYLTGFDAVVDSFQLRMYGIDWVFTHKPLHIPENLKHPMVCVHGHLHSIDKENKGTWTFTDERTWSTILVHPEYTFSAVSLCHLAKSVNTIITKKRNILGMATIVPFKPPWSKFPPPEEGEM